MRTIKKGAWEKFANFTVEEWRKSGTVIGPRATIDKNSYLCNPIHLSENSKIHHGCRLDKYSYVNWDVIIFPNVHIGSYCSIARNVQIGLANHPIDWLSTNSFQYSADHFPLDEDYQNISRKKNLHHPKTIIGSDVWVGANVGIRSGVKIGHGAIIAAGAIVSSDVEPYSIVGGVPARTIKNRFNDKVIQELLQLKWWLIPLKYIKDINFDDIDIAIVQIKQIKSRILDK